MGSAGTPPCLSQQAPKWAVTNQLSGRGKAATGQLIGHCPFRYSFGCILLLNQIYLKTMYRSTMPLSRLVVMIVSADCASATPQTTELSAFSSAFLSTRVSARDITYSINQSHGTNTTSRKLSNSLLILNTIKSLG